ncbi:phosphatase [Spirochaetia bacterium]|nr:phosphatase [Spirochaetia bacterium]
MNTREELDQFKPLKEFFAGIDSDGTVFDSMNIKHLKAFIPAAWQTWDWGDRANDFQRIWKHINLDSATRGINRFTALVMAFEQLADSITTNQTDFDPGPLRAFTENSAALSNGALQSWIEGHPHPFLDKVLEWSLESDRLFAEHTKNILPYKNVEAALKVLHEKADIMVVSSASGAGLDKDWSYSGLTTYTALVAGQEAGSKKDQLRLAARGKYPAGKTLMIGDAHGDLEAARASQALFFPVLPGMEEESWVRLREEGLKRFFAGIYQGEYENKLIGEFLNKLQDAVYSSS